MPMKKLAVTVNEDAVREIDRLIQAGLFPNRSKVIQHALDDLLSAGRRKRLARECAKLDPQEEQAFAEEMPGADEWPEY